MQSSFFDSAVQQLLMEYHPQTRCYRFASEYDFPLRAYTCALKMIARLPQQTWATDQFEINAVDPVWFARLIIAISEAAAREEESRDAISLFGRWLLVHKAQDWAFRHGKRSWRVEETPEGRVKVKVGAPVKPAADLPKWDAIAADMRQINASVTVSALKMAIKRESNRRRKIWWHWRGSHLVAYRRMGIRRVAEHVRARHRQALHL